MVNNLSRFDIDDYEPFGGYDFFDDENLNLGLFNRDGLTDQEFNLYFANSPSDLRRAAALKAIKETTNQIFSQLHSLTDRIRKGQREKRGQRLKR